MPTDRGRVLGPDRIHRTRSDDGTEIAGRVHGHGPPLVLVHGSLEDGDLDWVAMLPLLRTEFTCYTLSTRGRGLSGGSADLSPQRRVEDVTAFAESIGGPVFLFGESDGGVLALGAAARTSAVAAVAVHEPPILEAFDEETAATFENAIGRVAAAVAGGDRTAAVRILSASIANEDELQALSAGGHLEEAACYVPTFLAELEAQGNGHDPTDATALAAISAPVLVLHSARSVHRDSFAAVARHVATHVPDATVRELADSGHWAVTFAPQAVADELIKFFIRAAEPANHP